ncbi:MAG: phosphate acyltransferase PlsX [Clostridia bacterium]|nr:phosphate acyltransferase PlsX [Clostridia bacterium]
MKIVIDAFGGDYAPREVVLGVVKYLKKNNDVNFVLTGDEEKIKEELNDLGYEGDKIEIVHAPEVISFDDVPTKAIKEKANSSLAVAFDVLKRDEDCIGLISAGSTGAILAGGFLKIGRIKGVSRPALCPFMPTENGGHVLLIDCGANMDASAINLCHFAAMGSLYVKKVLGVENPRVALLNVGTEDHKGNELIHEVFPMLKKMNINFVGNMEARDLMSGKYDVVVADGFAGNVALKATEGALKLMMNEFKKAFRKNLMTKINALMLKPALKDLKKTFDFNSYGGAPILGCKKLIIKSHGSSKAETIVAAIEHVKLASQNKIESEIEEAVKDLTIENLGQPSEN